MKRNTLKWGVKSKAGLIRTAQGDTSSIQSEYVLDSDSSRGYKLDPVGIRA
ncbi:hypothetical protein [Ammoniphilus sp. CFH 90114]|uniref:hypothetical protein n=1 Tax=Ammoniphilus sp. CFH 90114 TaxID=2493665 RepID=UPI0013E90971|nr:hypothetical protein [Ammoniphilus sp. CFH 90114]